MKKIYVLLTAILMIMTTSIADAQLATTADGNNPMSFNIDANTLIVKLKSNATTGYTWKYKIDSESVIKFLSDKYDTPNNNGNPPLMGAGGEQTFVFEPNKSGKTKITFEYARPWAGGESAGKRFLKIKVDGQGKVYAKEVKR
jgi:inhibitor of cysteine peptidase